MTDQSQDRPKHHIDLRVLSDIAHTGVRRAVLFMGLGLNAMRRDDFNDYQLSTVPAVPGQTQPLMDFFPANIPLERVREYKEEFAFWIAGCGLREMLEHYALVLDQIHLHCMVMKRTLGEFPDPVDAQKAQERFQRLGLPVKFEILKKRFQIAVQCEESVGQLYVARNALTHDIGLVTAARAQAGKLTVSWRAFEISAVGQSSGVSKPLIEIIGKATDEETSIVGQSVTREKVFPVGSLIRLSQQDLSEICFYFSSIVISETIGAFTEFIKSSDVKFDAADGVPVGNVRD